MFDIRRKFILLIGEFMVSGKELLVSRKDVQRMGRFHRRRKLILQKKTYDIRERLVKERFFFILEGGSLYY